MKDLRTRLEDAAQPEHDQKVDYTRLLADGRRRVVRRRQKRGLAGAVLAAGAVAAAATLPEMVEGQSAPTPTTQQHPAAYESVRITTAEVESRCTTAMNRLHNYPSSSRWVAGRRDGLAVSATETGQAIELREGFEVPMRREGTRAIPQDMPPTCVIPQGELVHQVDVPPGEAPSPEDATAVARWCTVTTGYDLSNWQMLAAADEANSATAIFMSSNNHAATCVLADGLPSFLTITADAYRRDPAVAPRRFGVLYPNSLSRTPDGTTHATGYGVIAGMPDGLTIEVLKDDGSLLARTSTNRGAFAYSFMDRSDGAQGAQPHPPRLTFRVFDQSGVQLWAGQLNGHPDGTLHSKS